MLSVGTPMSPHAFILHVILFLVCGVGRKTSGASRHLENVFSLTLFRLLHSLYVRTYVRTKSYDF